MALGKPGARNAGILAAQILAVSDSNLTTRLEAFKKEMADQVERKAESLQASR
jgi:phosphoribosylamine--glycine ligase